MRGALPLGLGLPAEDAPEGEEIDEDAFAELMDEHLRGSDEEDDMEPVATGAAPMSLNAYARQTDGEGERGGDGAEEEQGGLWDDDDDDSDSDSSDDE